MRDLDWSRGSYLAEFSTADELSEAVRRFLEMGYTRVETFSPMPVDTIVPRTRSRLPVVVFAAGVAGAILSYAVEWYANAFAYVQNIGGRPAHAVPAFLVPALEGAILFAAVAAFAGFFTSARLPKLWHPVFEIPGFEGATVDRYWIAVDGADARTSTNTTEDELRLLKPLRVVLPGPVT